MVQSACFLFLKVHINTLLLRTISIIRRVISVTKATAAILSRRGRRQRGNMGLGVFSRGLCVLGWLPTPPLSRMSHGFHCSVVSTVDLSLVMLRTTKRRSILPRHWSI